MVASRVPLAPRTVAERWRSLTGRGSDRLLPQARLSGPMPWILAIFTLLSIVALAGALAIGNATGDARAAVEDAITVRIVGLAGEEREAAARNALAALSRVPSVSRVARVPDGRLREMLAPWLGRELTEQEGERGLPLPVLIDARLTDPSARAMQNLQAALETASPQARVERQAHWLAPALRALSALRWLAIGAALLLAIAMGAAVLMAARAALARHHDTLEVMHLLGASDSQIAEQFQRGAAIDAAIGAAAGSILAIVLLLLLAVPLAVFGSGLGPGARLMLKDWLFLPIIPLVAVLIAAATARLVVLRHLASAL